MTISQETTPQENPKFKPAHPQFLHLFYLLNISFQIIHAKFLTPRPQLLMFNAVIQLGQFNADGNNTIKLHASGQFRRPFPVALSPQH